MKPLYPLVLLVLLPLHGSAEDLDPTGIYLAYERAYLSNNAKDVSTWFTKATTISQTLHIPGVGPSSISVQPKQLLKGMKGQKPRAEDLLTAPSAVTIDAGTDDAFFCGTGGASRQTRVGDKEYREREVRRFCFRRDGARYVLESQKIDVYYD